MSLNLSKVPITKRTAVKNEVGEFIVDQILRSVSNATSPVAGKGAFKILNKEYADNQKGGNRKANLELDGDMLDALEFRTTSSGVSVGIFDEDEAKKGFNHNQGDTLPRRQFIPESGELFKRSIQSGVNRIIKDSESEPSIRGGGPVSTDITVESLFGDIFADLFGGANG